MSYGNGGQYHQSQAIGVGLVGGPSQPLSTQTVGMELERGNKVTGQLHGIIDQLFARLDPLLSAPVPASAVGGQPPPDTNSSVVRLLRAQGYRIDGACQRLTELIQRIEL